MPSVEHAQIVALLEGGLGMEALSLDEQRAAMDASGDMFPLEEDMVTDEVDAAGVPAEWVYADGTDTSRLVLYLHGGGYTLGSRKSHRGLAGRIARAAKARVLLPDYRLAPEHPFPAAVEDATNCWRWLMSGGYAPHHIAIAGDSAGGGLALSTVLALKAAGAALPACVIGLSPWTDLAGAGPTAQPGAVDDPMLSPEGLHTSARHYAPGDLRNPLAAPLHGDLEGFPPLLLQVGTKEILLSDSTRFADKAKSAGVEVTLEIEDGLIHVWQMFPQLPEAQSAVERIGAFIQQKC